ncbi:MAG TPA: metalloregulator ArsR/SmtB family transcription factor [Pseudomonadales bacterium]
MSHPKASSRNASAERNVAEAASVFAALGDETRLRIVTRLCRAGPQSIVRLTEGSRVTRQAVTKHLRALSRAGLVRGRRSGRETVWELEPRRLGEVRGYLDAISTQWDEAIDRLKAFVEPPEA